MSFGAYIPALADGSAAADGNPITHVGGKPHNQAENLTNQTDGDTAVFGGVSAWGDGASWTPLSFASMQTHLSGDLGLWIKWGSVNGVCVILEWAQYDIAKVWTPSEVKQMERWAKQGTCGAGFSALRDVNGELVLDSGGEPIFTAG